MRTISLFLIVFLAGQSVIADTSSDDSKTDEAVRDNVMDFRDWLMKELSQFPKPDQMTFNSSRRYAFIPKKPKVFTASEYNQAAKSDWVKCQVMSGLSLLSQQLASTAGTAFAPNSANELQENAVQLEQSNDPQFQQIGALYSQQAQALQTGNIAASDQIASQVSAIPPPSVTPGYQPSQSESALSQAFNEVIGTVLAGLGGVIGSMAVAELLQALGITNLGSLLGTGAATGSSMALGQSPGAALSSGGANVVQTGGGAVIEQIGSVNVKPLQPQNSANAGGAPLAQ